MSFIKLLMDECSGTTSVEYAVMLAMILMAVIGAIGALGTDTGGLWGNNRSELEAHLN